MEKYILGNKLLNPYKILRKPTKDRKIIALTLVWVGFLGARFEVGGGGKITLCLKLVRIMLET